MMNPFSIENPGPITSSEDPLAKYTALYKGMILQIEKDGLWWAGEVLTTLDDGRAVVHYLGWDLSYDEIVPRSRLQLDKEAAEKAKAVGPMEIMNQPGPIEPSGIALAPNEVSVGDHVHVDWNGHWYLGKVTRIYDDGQIGIHYVGWNQTWDEVLDITRLQKAP
ncbi:MAG: hypothetical protein P1V97_10140 [Planctomycetota bacterium]|nr:hypothetical protein [Planctomycetota bacterium]